MPKGGMVTHLEVPKTNRKNISNDDSANSSNLLLGDKKSNSEYDIDNYLGL